MWAEIAPAELRADRQDVVVDLFCGAGFFGLALACDAAAVHGFELSASAVANAQVRPDPGAQKQSKHSSETHTSPVQCRLAI